ncbi:dienelactone hydrolase family protein [Streptomyces sp. TP-A0874]|uniref:dienelactone hydrolase family protein n=1 Tax=Streptomyces sp. TP-A0874 TaxID=549819 RepID=UPI000853D834|nr:dienelactone hydrolase family protein [Streptomyces sp. TP-A0874]
MVSETARIVDGQATLVGDLVLPEPAHGVVLFAHGSGSSRHSPRNRAVAEVLHRAGQGTLLLDLLTEDEERVDLVSSEHRFDIPLLARRLLAAVEQLADTPATAELPLSLFGASTGAAAALTAAAERPELVRTVVSRGGRPDMAGDALGRVRVPVLLIVGSEDREVLRLNREAGERLGGPHSIHVVPGATHLFEEPGTLDEVATEAAHWFARLAADAAGDRG